MRLFAAAVVLAGCGRKPGHLQEAGDPLAALPAEGADPTILRLMTNPVSGGARTLAEIRPLARYLEEMLGIPVKLGVAKDYDGLEGLMFHNRTDIAIFSPLLYVRARRRVPMVILAGATVDGSPTYKGYLVVQAAAPYGDLDSLRGARVAWVDPSSTSGYLYPRALLLSAGHDPDSFFGSEQWAGDHLEAIQRVLDGRADVAAVASTYLDGSRDMTGIDRMALRVVAKTSRIPYDCVVVRTGLPRPVAHRIRAALLALDSKRAYSEALAQSWGFGAFVPIDDRRYDSIKKVLEADPGMR